jgi:hypothetical protein
VRLLLAYSSGGSWYAQWFKYINGSRKTRALRLMLLTTKTRGFKYNGPLLLD